MTRSHDKRHQLELAIAESATFLAGLNGHVAQLQSGPMQIDVEQLTRPQPIPVAELRS